MTFSTTNPSQATILQSLFLSHQNPEYFPRNLRFFEFRFRNRRRGRLKISVCFNNLIDSVISNLNLPSPSNPLDLIAGPALAVFSAASYFSLRNRRQRTDLDSDIGSWILFTSPTPFNRFVLLRCPTISFEESELLEGVNERLVSEDRHFVNLNSGRIPPEKMDGDAYEKKLSYQRFCIGMDDGGVLSLDWPVNLDLTKEHGLDSTLLIVPGTVEGSMDKNIRMFVCRALQNGCFPVVINPRGCAGSPVTTARLFTAADSDDICTAIQFINRSRPWTTLMGIGWGYGANILAKYLGEVSERTPLTAAVCIDNPFDLEEATRSFPHHVAMDQKLVGGLINILQSNKELFQGRKKGFSVAEGLSATSLRDFDKAISMISYGFNSIEEFYLKSSTRQLVGSLKIPVLFIQSDDGTVPLFSIPRSSISENPFTSLLLCSCLASSTTKRKRSAIQWCQHLAIEWLLAVELALLKGRHPLLKDVDITINPSKGLALVESRTVDRGYGNIQNRLNGHFNSKDLRVKLGGGGTVQEKSIDMLQLTNLGNDDLIKEEGVTIPDGERGHAVQAAELIMNMLDVASPGTLGEEQKKKVLTAMEHGETFMKALQGAVPEDVRGKLTAAVSDIVQTQGANLNVEVLSDIKWIPNVTSELKVKLEEKLQQVSSADSGYDSNSSADHMKTDIDNEGNSSMGEMSQGNKSRLQGDMENLSSGDELSNSPNDNQLVPEKSSARSESEPQPVMPKLQKSDGFGPQLERVSEGQTNASGVKDPDGLVESNGRTQAAQAPGAVESGPEGEKSKHQNDPESGIATVGERHNVNQIDNIGDPCGVGNWALPKEVTNIPKNDDGGIESSAGPGRMFSSFDSEASSPPISDSSEPPLMEKEEAGNVKSKEKNAQVMKQSSSSKAEEPSAPLSSPPTPPEINVSQALDALTGFDDSTQMAVTSVFGVIENMIDHLEKEKTQGDAEKENKNEDEQSDMSSDEHPVVNSNGSEEKEVSTNGLCPLSDVMQSNDLASNHFEKCSELDQDVGNKLGNTKFTQDFDSSFMNSISRSQGNVGVGNLDMRENSGRLDLMDASYFMENSNKIKHAYSFPLHITLNACGDSLYKEYLRKCVRSMMSNTKPLDLDSTHDLLLEYFPEDGQWKHMGQLESSSESEHDLETSRIIDGKVETNYVPLEDSNEEKIIEPSYVILDNELEQQPTQGHEIADEPNRNVEPVTNRVEELMTLVKSVVLDALKVEVSRRLGMSNMEVLESNLANNMDNVADVVAMTVAYNNQIDWSDPTTMMFGTVQGEEIINAISLAVQEASHLRKVLPVGMIVGSTLAALRKNFHVFALYDGKRESIQDQAGHVGGKSYDQQNESKNNHHGLVGSKDVGVDSSLSRGTGRPETAALNNDTVMVGAVTAALGASALLAHHKSKDHHKYNESTEQPSGAINVQRELQKEADKLEEAIQEKNQNNFVTSLAEKAISVAAPVVPTKSDGEVDQERLVAMLADLGQKGGMLRLIGKVALLWGGIRGAMSLTDKLISFLRIAERPLFQRILGFIFMVLVLWSPVVIPLLPTLVQNWVARCSTGIAEYACIIGLYTAVMILVMLWGKRIREYENPLEEYGLGMTSSQKFQNLLKGLIGGAMLILCIHSMNVALDCADLVYPSWLSSSRAGSIMWLKAFGRILSLAARGIMPAFGVAIVEELLFRSWLPEEIAVDLGYHHAIIISGLSFSLIQRSPSAVPGLWLLSLALAGAKQRGGNNLSLPIGIRAGAMIANFILQNSGFLAYHSDVPFWVTGIHPWQPFGGVVGLIFCITLAVLLYPRQSPRRKRISRLILD